MIQSRRLLQTTFPIGNAARRASTHIVYFKGVNLEDQNKVLLDNASAKITAGSKVAVIGVEPEGNIHINTCFV
jgi:ABC-type molybdenum transport system ATPase subunit/photorepair protein PhrA